MVRKKSMEFFVKISFLTGLFFNPFHCVTWTALESVTSECSEN